MLYRNKNVILLHYTLNHEENLNSHLLLPVTFVINVGVQKSLHVTAGRHKSKICTTVCWLEK